MKAPSKQDQKSTTIGSVSDRNVFKRKATQTFSTSKSNGDFLVSSDKDNESDKKPLKATTGLQRTSTLKSKFSST